MTIENYDNFLSVEHFGLFRSKKTKKELKEVRKEKKEAKKEIKKDAKKKKKECKKLKGKEKKKCKKSVKEEKKNAKKELKSEINDEKTYIKCSTDKKLKKYWKHFYRREVDQNSKFAKVSTWQQLLWFGILFVSGIFGQILFRLYFNVWNIQKIWYVGVFFLFPPLVKLFLHFSLISGFFLIFGCFWALPIYDTIASAFDFFPLKFIFIPILRAIFAPWLNKKYQLNQEFDFKNRKFVYSDFPTPFNKIK